MTKTKPRSLNQEVVRLKRRTYSEEQVQQIVESNQKEPTDFDKLIELKNQIQVYKLEEASLVNQLRTVKVRILQTKEKAEALTLSLELELDAIRA